MIETTKPEKVKRIKIWQTLRKQRSETKTKIFCSPRSFAKSFSNSDTVNKLETSIQPKVFSSSGIKTRRKEDRIDSSEEDKILKIREKHRVHERQQELQKSFTEKLIVSKRNRQTQQLKKFLGREVTERSWSSKVFKSLSRSRSEAALTKRKRIFKDYESSVRVKVDKSLLKSRSFPSAISKTKSSSFNDSRVFTSSTFGSILPAEDLAAVSNRRRQAKEGEKRRVLDMKIAAEKGIRGLMQQRYLRSSRERWDNVHFNFGRKTFPLGSWVKEKFLATAFGHFEKPNGRGKYGNKKIESEVCMDHFQFQKGGMMDHEIFSKRKRTNFDGLLAEKF